MRIAADSLYLRQYLLKIRNFESLLLVEVIIMVDIVEVLNKLEALGLIHQAKRTGNHMMIRCPFHSDGKEQHPSCGVLLTDEVRDGKKTAAGHFHCFACHTSKRLPDAVDFLLKQKKISQDGVSWLRENIPGYDPSLTDNFDYLLPAETVEALTNKYAVDYFRMLTKPKQSYVSEEELAKYRFTIPYMYERKLTDAIIDKFDIGYQADWVPPGRKRPVPCITFPVRDRTGGTLFFCRRSIEGKLFNYPEGVTKPVYGLYELPKGIKSVVIVESCFNALTCWVYGKPAVALLGTGNSYQINQLKQLGVHEFILGFDPDDAGKKATEKLKKALRSVAMIYQFEGIPEGMDINDLSKEEFDALEVV